MATLPNTANSLAPSDQAAQNNVPLQKLRRKLKVVLLLMESIGAGGMLVCLGVLVIPALRRRTWVVLCIGLFQIALAANIGLMIIPASSSSNDFRFGFSSRIIKRVSPSSASAPELMRNPVAILARSQLAEAASLRNQAGEFLPPQEQPRAGRLKWVAHLLQGAMLNFELLPLHCPSRLFLFLARQSLA